VAMGGYAAVMAAMYPIMIENDELFSAYMQTFPQEFLAAFGMTGSLGDPGVFFTTYIGSWLWPIMAAVVALLLGTRVAVDLDRGFLDLPLATPVSRIRYLTGSIIGQALAMALVAAATVGVLWVVGVMVGGDFDPGRFAVAAVLCWLFGCAIAGVTTLLTVVSLSRGRAAGIVSAILIAMYLVYVVVQISVDWAWLAPVSAWDHFRTTELIDKGVVSVADLALFAGVALGGWGAALAIFRRRDLAA
jgi:ABC-2 type transport system permease protein